MTLKVGEPPLGRTTGARVCGVLLLLVLPVALLALFACAHTAMHRSGEDGFYFTGMLAPLALTALWLLWFGIVLVTKAAPGPAMRIPGGIAFLACISGIFMNVWRMGGYPEDRPLALLYLAPAIGIGFAGIGNMLDQGKPKTAPARIFYIVAPIAFVAWIGLAFVLNQAMRD